MMFGEVRVDEAEGLILAHSLRLAGAMLKKGRVLTAADVRLLKTEGINFVTGARLEDGDLGEDEASRILAEALAGDGVTVGPAFSGRCNLFAAEHGLVAIDRDRLDRLNLVDEAVTVATAQPFEAVSRRQLVATIKIIPFGVDRRVVDACTAFATAGGPLVTVRPFVPRDTTLILTTLPGLRASVLDAFAEVTRARVEALGGRVVQEIRCPHEVGALERTLAKAAASGCHQILVAGGSATVDRRDTVPTAIQRAGGSIDHFGMPVDPGNLLLLARIGSVPVVNLPGCGRSPKPNGLDWVLRRLAAGVVPSPRDIMRMGAGGLLKEMTRPTGIDHSEPGEPRVAAVVLADTDARELLGDLRGKPRVGLVVEDALKAGLDPVVVVVTGDDPEEIEEALPTCDLLLVRGGGLQAGIAALPADSDATVILPAHEARVGPAHLSRMARAFDPDEGRGIVVTLRQGRRDCPVLVGHDLFGALADGTAPQDLPAEHPEMVFELAGDES